MLRHIEPLTEQQIMAVCVLQQSAQETEEALSHGLEALSHSVSNAIASGELSYTLNVTDYMVQMAVAMDKLAAIEGFVRQVKATPKMNFINVKAPLIFSSLPNHSFKVICEKLFLLFSLISVLKCRPRI